MRIGWVVLLSASAALSAADKKIVINAVDPHNGWAFTEAALREYSDAGKDVAIVLAKSSADMARETTDADAVIVHLDLLTPDLLSSL